MKGFKILEYGDISTQIETLHQYGWDNGLYVGFPEFKDKYNMIAGGCTDWTAWPGHGKTELVLELLFNMSSFYDWRHLLYVPDIGKSIEVMAKLIHKFTGKTFIKRYSNYIDIKTAYQSCGWLLDHFKIMHRTDSKARITPVQLWEYAVKVKDEFGINTVMIDSWKDMNHTYEDHGGSYAKYLSNTLPVRNDIAELHNLHFHTIIHPKQPLLSGKDRKLYAPTPNDMEGGAQWNNSGKCIISLFREEYESHVTDIYFRKIKPESVGKTTSIPVSLSFDIVKSRYYYIDANGGKHFAAKEPPPPPMRIEYAY